MSKPWPTQKRKITTVKDPTKYYRATYVNRTGDIQCEVFISSDLDAARVYATGTDIARGRQLRDLHEYDDLIDSLI